MRRISKAGIDLLKDLEGFKGHIYDDGSGNPTIGYGHKVKVNEVFDHLTEQEAHELLLEDVRQFEDFVNENVTVELNQNQFDALVLFFFNNGTDVKNKKNFYKYLKAGDFINLLGYWMMYINSLNKYTGKHEVVPGLITRRLKEIALFNTKISEKVDQEVKHY